MFGLDPEVVNLVVTCFTVLAVYSRYARPPMKKAVNWEEVAKLEHEFGIDHIKESSEACPTPELHVARPVLSGSGVETLARALAFGALGPNEIRAVVDKCCENYWPCDSCRKKNDSRQMGQRLLGVPYKPGDPRHPDEYDQRINPDFDIVEPSYLGKVSYGRRLEHIYPKPGEPGYPPKPPRGNAGCSP